MFDPTDVNRHHYYNNPETPAERRARDIVDGLSERDARTILAGVLLALYGDIQGDAEVWNPDREGDADTLDNVREYLPDPA